MDTRHIILNEWQLLPEDWVLAVASRIGTCYQNLSINIGCREVRSLMGGIGIYRCKPCNCASQSLQVFHDDFSSQRTKVFRDAPFHWVGARGERVRD